MSVILAILIDIKDLVLTATWKLTAPQEPGWKDNSLTKVLTAAFAHIYCPWSP